MVEGSFRLSEYRRPVGTQANLFSTFTTWHVAAGVADSDRQPAAGISFSKMAANQASCPSTLQATESASLTVMTVQVEGASLLSR
jgi:hypothetical protein